jgi:hypothetical protein
MGSNLPNFDRAEYVQPLDPTGMPTGPGFTNESVDHAVFVKAITYGVGAAIVGCLCYAAFTIITHIEIGYLAIGVAWLIAKAMMTASEGLGGRKYQIAAVVLTYFAVSLAAIPEALWSMHAKGHDLTHASGGLIVTLLGYGLASPFLELTEGFGGIIGLFILFIGVRAAWRMTAGRRTY